MDNAIVRLEYIGPIEKWNWRRQLTEADLAVHLDHEIPGESFELCKQKESVTREEKTGVLSRAESAS
jgi:hypothetical protein